MDPILVLAQARDEGLSICLESEGKLSIAGEYNSYVKWKSLIKNLKKPIIEFISTEKKCSFSQNSKSQFVNDLINMGVHKDNAIAIFNRLRLRDDANDDRRLCYECAYLRGAPGKWICANSLIAGISFNGR